ncbi:hypothetical protein C8J57DRAFT_1639836, partial [Mycena rebaudengoi]
RALWPTFSPQPLLTPFWRPTPVGVIHVRELPCVPLSFDAASRMMKPPCTVCMMEYSRFVHRASLLALRAPTVRSLSVPLPLACRPSTAPPVRACTKQRCRSCIRRCLSAPLFLLAGAPPQRHAPVFSPNLPSFPFAPHVISFTLRFIHRSFIVPPSRASFIVHSYSAPCISARPCMFPYCARLRQVYAHSRSARLAPDDAPRARLCRLTSDETASCRWHYSRLAAPPWARVLRRGLCHLARSARYRLRAPILATAPKCARSRDSARVRPFPYSRVRTSLRGCKR